MPYPDGGTTGEVLAADHLDTPVPAARTLVIDVAAVVQVRNGVVDSPAYIEYTLFTARHRITVPAGMFRLLAVVCWVNVPPM